MNGTGSRRQEESSLRVSRCIAGEEGRVGYIPTDVDLKVVMVVLRLARLDLG